jgi:hypothetical protein
LNSGPFGHGGHRPTDRRLRLRKRPSLWNDRHSSVSPTSRSRERNSNSARVTSRPSSAFAAMFANERP